MKRSDFAAGHRKTFVLLALMASILLSLIGCGHIDIRKSAKIDLAEQTITVPTNGFGFDARLNKALYRHGWKMGGANTRYTLNTIWYWDGYCVEDECPIYKFRISITDNRTSEILLKMSGRHSQEAIVAQFNKALQIPPRTDLR